MELEILKEIEVEGIDMIGPKGDKGDTGPQGPKGEKGDKGDQGEPGAVKMQVVDTLPETGRTDTIYLVKKDNPGEQNLYDEYVYTETGWEHIGDTSVDLSDYYTKEESNEKLLTKQDKLVAGSGIELDGNVIKSVPNFSTYSIYYAKPKDGEDYILINDLPAEKYPSDVAQNKKINILPTGLDLKIRKADGSISDITGLGDINGRSCKKGFRAVIIYYNGDSLEEMTGNHATVSMLVYNLDSPQFYLGYLYKNSTSITSPGSAFPSGSIMTTGEVAYRYAKKDNVLTKTNTTSYTPTGNYHPATKKYVDDSVVLSKDKCFYFLEGPIRYDASMLINDTDTLNRLSQIMTDYYPKYLANKNLCCVIFGKDDTSASNGCFITLQGRGTKFYYTYPYRPSYSTDYGKIGYLDIIGNWDDSAKTYTVSNNTIIQIVSYKPTKDYNPSTKLYTDKTHYENMTGYDATKTQVLKNINGTLTWVNEE
jgi:hypothetical protein